MKSITNELERKSALIEARAAVRKLESNQTENMNSANSRRIQEKFAASKARNQAAADQLAAEEIQRLAAEKVAASKPAAPPVAAKSPPAPLAPKAPAPPTAASITAAEFVASQNSDGPRMTRSEFNKLTERQKKRLADSGGRIVPDAAAPTKAKPSFSHLTGIERAKAAAKHEAAEKAKNAAR